MEDKVTALEKELFEVKLALAAEQKRSAEQQDTIARFTQELLRCLQSGVAEDAGAHDPYEAQQKPLLQLLQVLKCGASLAVVDADGRTLGHWAALEGQHTAIRTLHDLGATSVLSSVDASGWTPMHYAASEGHTQVVKVLHELGIDAQQADHKGRTAAHWSARQGRAEVLVLLQQAGAFQSFLVCDKDGCTPAHLAARQGHVNLLQLLHDFGAGESFSTKDNRGRTPYDLGNDSVKHLLQALAGESASPGRNISDDDEDLEHARMMEQINSLSPMMNGL